MENELLFFFGFIAFVLVMLTLDLGVFNRKEQEVTIKAAIGWTAVWVSFALVFYFILFYKGDWLHGVHTFADLQDIILKYKQPITIVPEDLQQSLANYRHVLALEYITGYIVEESLSMDNLFVILLVFTSFNIEKKYHHSILFWGILGAIIFRFLFIFVGAMLVSRFEWILYLFATFLVYAGAKLLFGKDSDESIDTEKHPVVRFASKYFRTWPELVGNKFFVIKDGLRYITPLFLVLLIVEFSDLVFAVDSIPAIFAITKDPYIVFFSNIFAILGLRSLFFLIQNLFGKLRFFKYGLSALLIFIGLKMLFHHYIHEWGFTTAHSLWVILGVLSLSVVASFLFPKKELE